MAVVINGEALLTGISLGQEGKISKISGGGEMIRRLEALGLRPGKKVKKISSVFNRGPVIVDIDGRMVAVGHGQASRIFIAADTLAAGKNV